MQAEGRIQEALFDIQGRLEQYRKRLLDFGMLEPTCPRSAAQCRMFYKPIMSLTALIINLQEKDDHVQVTYGYASTAFTKFAGDENALIEHGVSDENITIRERVAIFNETDEIRAEKCIRRMYEAYLNVSKEELLNQAKAKRKEFLQQIAVKLKPLGFRKKAAVWTRNLEGDYVLTFHAQKSAYSDQYYFNVNIRRSGIKAYHHCYYVRIDWHEEYLFDWQAWSAEERESFINERIVLRLSYIVKTPLRELGKDPDFQNEHYCQNATCENCWIENNLRED